MINNQQNIVQTLSKNYRYPASHWTEISHFVVGDKRDPKDLFSLAEDVWDAWPYAHPALPSRAGDFRFRFGHLNSFLKPYIKWYCYQRLLATHGMLSRYTTAFPHVIDRADAYLVEHHFESPDEIAPDNSFRPLWEAQLLPQTSEDASASRAKVRVQVRTHAFWKHIQRSFGFPQVVPPVEHYEQSRLTESAFDEHQVIPVAVIRQFSNKLALHRDGRELLNRFHHLRLCVLMLEFALGRRISEILMAPRGTGSLGPLAYCPAKGYGQEGALWFQFSPNKLGPNNQVHVSREWEDVVTYCVKELIRYSDEIRKVASPEISGFLILISPGNLTGGMRGFLAHPVEDIDGPIYHLRTHQARHTRQSAIASDPRISPLTKKRDLNHISRNMQVHYQHNARQQNEMLLEKVKNGQLVGPAMEWFSAIFDPLGQNDEHQSSFRQGQPQFLSPRWRNLIQNNPQFMQFNRVLCGYCALPQGPGACEKYMNCTTAEDGGCQWFCTDPANAGMLIQITQTTRKYRQKERESTKAGHEVQAEKYNTLALRSESLEKEVLSRCDIEALPNSSQDIKERLKARKREIEESS